MGAGRRKKQYHFSLIKKKKSLRLEKEKIKISLFHSLDSSEMYELTPPKVPLKGERKVHTPELIELLIIVYDWDIVKINSYLQRML